jgi:photosystem II stability/assembly factor-like uncharacterized protein
MTIWLTIFSGQNFLLSGHSFRWSEVVTTIAAGLILLHSPHDVIEGIATAGIGEGKSVFVISRHNLLRSSESGRWRRLTAGLGGWKLSSLVLSPNFAVDKTMFVASLGGGVFRSGDGGLSWTSNCQGLCEPHILLLGISPDFERSRILFALGLTGRIYRSADAGDTWTLVWTTASRPHGDGAGPADAANILIDPLRDAGEAWTKCHWIDGANCIAFARDAVVIGTSDGELFASRDCGESWARLARAPEHARITSIEIPQGRGLSDPFFVGTDSIGVLRVTEGGQGISIIVGPKPLLRVTSLGTFTDEAGRPVLVACSWTDALFVSRDDGATWTLAKEGLTRHHQADESRFGAPHFRAFAAAPGLEDMYVGGFDGLFRLRGRERAWEPVETLPLGNVLSVAISPPVGDKGSSIAVATYGAGVYLKSSGAPGWKILNSGLKTLRLGTISFSPHWQSDRMLFTVSEGCVLRSVDEGGPWSATHLRPSGVWRRRQVGWFGRFRKAERILARHLSDRGIRRIKDIFQKTALHVAGRLNRYVFPTLLVFSRNYAEDQTLFVGTREHGVFCSHDGGQSFTQIWNAGGCFVTSLDLSSGPRYQLFAALSNGLHSSEDYGATWSRISADGQFRNARIAVSPSLEKDGVVFAGGREGLVRSRDGGGRWETIRVDEGPGGCAIGGVALSPEFGSDRSLLVYVHGRGLYRSMDGGGNFERLPWEAPASDPAFTPLLCFPDCNTLFQFSPNFANDRTIVAAAYDQVYVSRDWGLTWAAQQRPTRYESSRREIVYRGRWTVAEHTSFSATTAHHSRFPQDTASLRFIGAQVTWMGTKGPDQGIADVLIDGELCGTVDLFAPSHEFVVNLYSTALTQGEHEITIRVSGSRNERALGTEVWIDAFDVD